MCEYLVTALIKWSVSILCGNVRDRIRASYSCYSSNGHVAVKSTQLPVLVILIFEIISETPAFLMLSNTLTVCFHFIANIFHATKPLFSTSFAASL